jgi:hypothetical protein
MLEDEQKLYVILEKTSRKKKVPFPEGTAILLMIRSTTITIIGGKYR